MGMKTKSSPRLPNVRGYFISCYEIFCEKKYWFALNVMLFSRFANVIHAHYILVPRTDSMYPLQCRVIPRVGLGM